MKANSKLFTFHYNLINKHADEESFNDISVRNYHIHIILSYVHQFINFIQNVFIFFR